MTVNHRTVEFLSSGQCCRGELLLPDKQNLPPLVIMAHGFGGERKFRLPAFAQRFCEAGMAVLLFDYRYFGDSEGSPRQRISIDHQLQDWHSALDFAAELEGIDHTRVALWGTSFSGAHVISVAAQRQDEVSAVVSQVPFAGGLAVAGQMPLTKLLRCSLLGVSDAIKSLWGGGQQVPIYGEPERFALLNTPECLQGYGGLIEGDTQWKNQTPARIALEMALYQPASSAVKVTCPALVIGATEDSLVPIAAVERMAKLIPDCEWHVLECNHFDPYYGDNFEINIAVQLEFLKAKLLSEQLPVAV